MTRTLTIMTMLVLAALWCAGCDEGDGGAAGSTVAVGRELEAAAPSTPAGTPRLVPLGLSLPKPMFKGTPRALPFVPNMEERWYRKRPPFLVPPGTMNMALGKPVTGSDNEPIIGELNLINDGDKDSGDGYFVELDPGRQWVQIDLQAETAVYAIVLWHYHQRPTIYHDVVVQLSNDPDFIDVVTVFNNDHDNSSGLGIGRDKSYVETYQGKLIDGKGFSGRYVRLWSKENCDSEYNQYVEVEVHGRPVDAPPTPIVEPMDNLHIDLPHPMFCG